MIENRFQRYTITPSKPEKREKRRSTDLMNIFHLLPNSTEVNGFQLVFDLISYRIHFFGLIRIFINVSLQICLKSFD